ncbi:cyclophilin-like protein [Auriculariales sp. MPI-PUGE-AT-0066]|nr:cyclophilin-like protein [Auriculariales sp. MPI-PUGE-AT-0066]
MSRHATLTIGIGNKNEHAELMTAHENLATFLEANATSYGLASNALSDLDEDHRELLREAYAQRQPDAPFIIDRPKSLVLSPLRILLHPSPGLAKTTGNFAALCTGERGSQKKAPCKPYHYKGTPIHRIERGFVLQGGDITRGDGSGGDSIYGGALPLEKAGLKPSALEPPLKWGIGAVAMAASSSGKATSQFFICVTDDPAQLKKLDGKYVVFGQVVGNGGWTEVLRSIEDRGAQGEPVWVEDCGLET